MSDFLSRLVNRTTGKPAAIRPRLAPVYSQMRASDLAARDEVQQSDPTVGPPSLQPPPQPPHKQQPVEPEQENRAPAQTRPETAAESLPRSEPEKRSRPSHSETHGSGEVERPGRHDHGVVPSTDLEPPESQSFIYRPLLPVSIDVKTAAAAPLVISRFQARPAFLFKDKYSDSPAIGPEPPGPHATAQPDITVSIGRIDVRAVAAPAPVTAPPPRRSPTLTLEEYIKQRNQGVR